MTQSEATILESFMSRHYVDGQMAVQHTPLYDTVTIAAGGAVNATTASFFTNVGPASGKTLAQTNMRLVSQLPAPQAFCIYGVRVRWSENILLADLISILNGFALTFVLGDRAVQQAPLWYFPAGGGIDGFTTRNDSSVYTNGNPTREAMHKLAIPIVIESVMNFYAQLDGNAFTLAAANDGGTGLTIQLLLDGLYAKGVE